ncbi:MAG: primosomal protein [Phycicoccus sp.]|uniref:primosomal protein n=1 Tax=Phycicoccus sp. TaxID=1902410 RepID=UPI001D394C5D|nr:primosomal protein [Phycicoccus sp.]MCB1238871.1 primosomal protein [Tetrasphaera sp.]MCB9405581.1 primosomal protein [Tetrasphaera sp.]MCO5301675.1 primosomal protein [Phycicoccus sp.]
MSADPRAALSVLVSAFERHLEACAGRRGEDDPTVAAAYDDLVEAFEAYDGALYDATGEMTPFDIYADDAEEGDEEEDDDVDDDFDDDLYDADVESDEN